MTTKEKILEQARILFFSIGYEKTSIQRIIDEVGIAKGTFYHHFKSKEELLEELTDTMVSGEVQKSRAYIRESDDDAITKFNRFVNMQSEWKSKQYDILYVVLNAMYATDNIKLKQLINQKNIEKYSPLISHIIKQGVKEGVFDTPFPEEIGLMIFKMSISESDEIASMMLNYSEYEDPVSTIIDRYKIFFHTMERLLGAKEDTFKFQDKRAISDFIDYMKERDAK